MRADTRIISGQIRNDLIWQFSLLRYAAMTGTKTTATPGPKKPKKEQPVVAHYTNAAGLFGIITHNQFWASKSTFMNDPGEIAYAWTIYKELLAGCTDAQKPLADVLVRKIEGLLEAQDMFVLSFSFAIDNLSLWKMYNDASGYCLQIDLNRLIEEIAATTAKKRLNGFHAVVYGKAFHDSVARRLLDHFLSAQAGAYVPDIMFGPESAEVKNHILDSLFAFKKDDYSNEKEIRAIFTVPNLTTWVRDVWKETVKFRARGTQIVPYVEVPLRTHHWLKGVVVGPCARDSREREGVELFLKSKGIDVPVTASNCAYRR